MLAFLIRHGESETNVSGHFPDDQLNSPHLTENGRRQAVEAAQMFTGISVDAIFSSPLPRALETAEIISKKTGVKITVDDRLCEVELGSLKGRKTSEVLAFDPNWFDEYFNDSSKYGIEKYSRIQERMMSALQSARNSNLKSAIFVSHLEPIRSLVSLAIGIDGRLVRRIKISNASITIFKYEGSLELNAVNLRPLKDFV